MATEDPEDEIKKPSGWLAGRWTQEEAAQLPGMCERTIRRYIDRYEEDGFQGLIDKRLNQVSHRRAREDESMRPVEQYRRRHDGWSAAVPAPEHPPEASAEPGVPLAAITRPNPLWAIDITYVPMRKGCVYLAAVLDWATRWVLARTHSVYKNPVRTRRLQQGTLARTSHAR